MKSILEARDVHYRYPGTDTEALQGLKMSIPKHKKTAICGHNGSGKSTFSFRRLVYTVLRSEKCGGMILRYRIVRRLSKTSPADRSCVSGPRAAVDSEHAV